MKQATLWRETELPETPPDQAADLRVGPSAAFSQTRLKSKFRTWIGSLANGLLGLAFPPCCAHCGAAVESDSIAPQLCESCIARIFTPQSTACRRCGVYGVRKDMSQRKRQPKSVVECCLECRDQKFAFDEVFSLGVYTGPLQEAVVRMKNPSGESLAHATGRALAAKIENAGLSDRPEFATCVPKYWLKRLRTGANSAEQIMSGVAKQAKLPMFPDLLICRRRIRKQSLLSPEQRRRNVRDAWRVSNDYEIVDAHVLLVDDILTTGATAHFAARALKSAGARRVSLAVVGRALRGQ